MTNQIDPEDIWPKQVLAWARQKVRALKDGGSDRANQIAKAASATTAWLRRHYLWVLIPIGVIGYGVTWVYITWRLWPLIRGILVDMEGAGADDTRAYAYAVGALLTAFVVLATLPVALIKTWVNERTTRNAEQGHITDRLNAAIQMLGAEKTRKFRVRTIVYDLPTGDDTVPVETNQRGGHDPDPPIHTDAQNIDYGRYETSEETLPNLEVRLGAIYALERIAQDSERDHITVMETLCAYIRENAPASMAQDHDLDEWPDWPEDADAAVLEARDERLSERREKFYDWIRNLPAPRVDIQAAFTVIGRRSEDRIAFERRSRQSQDPIDPGFRLDLRNTCLQAADLTRARLGHALMQGARMERASLYDARMEGAYLSRARLEGADLYEARMAGANLAFAWMEGASLFEAWMERAYLGGARMEEAELGGAWMERANLRGARLEGARLYEARMAGADLGGARMERASVTGAVLKSADLSRCTIARTHLRSADFTQAKNLTQDAVNTAFGDAGTKLPEGLIMPDHWDDETDPDYPDEKYNVWIEAGAPPGKPKS